MAIPWDLPTSNPVTLVILPFLWLCWQIYLPRITERIVGIQYETWWVGTRDHFESKLDTFEGQVKRIDDNLEDIRETQQKLTNVTVAQTKMLNGHEGNIDVDRVKEQLLDESEDRPEDYLYGGERK